MTSLVDAVLILLVSWVDWNLGLVLDASGVVWSRWLTVNVWFGTEFFATVGALIQTPGKDELKHSSKDDHPPRPN